MLRTFISLAVGLMLTATSAIAQTTTDPAAPAVPAGAPEATGGLADWWWLIILVIIIAAIAWYFMKKRKPTGRV